MSSFQIVSYRLSDWNHRGGANGPNICKLSLSDECITVIRNVCQQKWWFQVNTRSAWCFRRSVQIVSCSLVLSHGMDADTKTNAGEVWPHMLSHWINSAVCLFFLCYVSLTPMCVSLLAVYWHSLSSSNTVWLVETKQMKISQIFYSMKLESHVSIFKILLRSMSTYLFTYLLCSCS